MTPFHCYSWGCIVLLLSSCGDIYDVYSYYPPTESEYQRRYKKNKKASYSFDCNQPLSIGLDTITDRFYQNQNYLSQMQVQQAWQIKLSQKECFGKGVTIALVDSSIDKNHEDLYKNIDLNGSYDVITEKKGHIPFLNQIQVTRGSHATMVAGVIASDANGFGIVGIANKSQLQSYNLLEKQTMKNKIISMSADGDIINNSWGPSDKFPVLSPLPTLIKEAIDAKIKYGRGGRGTIYVWAAGNGGRSCGELISGRLINKTCNNNSNYDGYANYRKVIAVAALETSSSSEKTMKKAYFSEKGANLLVSAPGYRIMTTKVTPFKYTNRFNGTSASTPMVSGIIALLLESNPQLGWRDVRLILAQSSKKIDKNDEDWKQNGSGLWVNHKYGYGLINAKATINLSKNWINLPNEISHTVSIRSTIDPYSPYREEHFQTILQVNRIDTNISSLESVELNIQATHQNWSKLSISFTSPQGTTSHITEQHDCFDYGYYGKDKCKGQYLSEMTFSSARLIGENPIGKWTVHINDSSRNLKKIKKITLKLYGNET